MIFQLLKIMINAVNFIKYKTNSKQLNNIVIIQLNLVKAVYISTIMK